MRHTANCEAGETDLRCPCFLAAVATIDRDVLPAGRAAGPTRTWRVTSGAGVDLGVYPGATRAAALDAMAREAGYPDHETACADSGDDGAALRVVEGDVVTRPAFDWAIAFTEAVLA